MEVRSGGRVWLVGAGPGDPELLTLKAARLLREADVVIHDRLVGRHILELARPEAERIYVGKERSHHILRQAEINALLVNRARRGQRVVRLKGGDPLIFGRGGEEIVALVEAGIPFEIVPGITAAAGCAASAVVPLTHRDHAQVVVLATGHGKEGEADLDWTALCRPAQTLVFYMGHKVLQSLCGKLVEHGLPGSMPALLIENGTLQNQRVVRGTLSNLADTVAALELAGPALVIIGEVAGLHPEAAVTPSSSSTCHGSR